MYIIFDHLMRFECINKPELDSQFPKIIQPSINYKKGEIITFNILDPSVQVEVKDIAGQYEIVDIKHYITFLMEGEQETVIYLERK